jgi:hypothetical protein
MMLIEKMSEIVTMCSALDGQQVTDSKVAMWLEVLDGCTYEECRDAIVPAYREASNGIVTAKGLWDVVRRDRAEPGLSDREVEEASWVSDPQPICEAHDLPILACDDCCKLIFHEAGFMREGERHSWAMVNVYKAKELWA